MSEIKTIGIVMATKFEARPILKACGFKRSHFGHYIAKLNGHVAYLAISGIGMEPARRAAYSLCDAGAQELISAGYCGALVPDLQVGELLTDRIATSPKAIWKRSERQALAEKAGARAVDMETQAIIEAGTRRGVPIRVMRVVSDRLGDDVSPLLGDDVVFSPARMALRLINPRNWPYAYQMWKQSRIANRQLVQAVTAYLRQP
jgi:nucleoside phosphorylase